MSGLFLRKGGRRKAGGFTLIELMIVIAIIGILAAILIPNYIRARDRSSYQGAIGALSGIKTALEIIRTEEDISSAALACGANIQDCVAAEMIVTGSTCAGANGLAIRMNKSVKTFGGGGDWACGDIAVPAGVQGAQYNIGGYTRGIKDRCNIFTTEVEAQPSVFDNSGTLPGATGCVQAEGGYVH